MPVYHCVVDGLIASGKTSIVDELQQMGFDVEKQKLDEWTLLTSYYENPAKYAMALQKQVLGTYIDSEDPKKYEKCEKSSEVKFVFHESCALASLCTFGRMLVDDGYISSQQYNELAQMVARSPFKFQWYFYTKTSVNTCMERFQKRGRPGEKVKEQYQRKLKSYYYKFIDELEQSGENVRYICNETAGGVKQVATHIVERYVKKNRRLMRVAVCGNIGAGKTTLLRETQIQGRRGPNDRGQKGDHL
jgi:deoxyadenosine/deoxycytidine kinase